jgi:hypothetical protein
MKVPAETLEPIPETRFSHSIGRAVHHGGEIEEAEANAGVSVSDLAEKRPLSAPDIEETLSI